MGEIAVPENPVATVVLTRRRADNRRLAERLTRKGLRVLEAPALEIVSADPPELETVALGARSLKDFQAALFSSRHGVTGFFRWLKKSGRFGKPEIVAAVGPATARALAEYGWPPYVVADPATGAELAKRMQPRLPPTSRLLAVRGNTSRDAASKSLAESGHRIFPLTVYRNLETVIPRIAAFQLAVFASPSAVKRFLASNPPVPETAYVAIGSTTARALREHGLSPVQARTTSDEALEAAVFEALGRAEKR